MKSPVTFTQHRTPRGKKLDRWTAKLGDYEAEGTTRDEAQASLVTLIEGANTYRREYLFTQSGELFCVYNCAGRWGYDITGPGRAYPCSTFGRATYEEARQDAIRHIEQAFGGVIQAKAA